MENGAHPSICWQLWQGGGTPISMRISSTLSHAFQPDDAQFHIFRENLLFVFAKMRRK